MSLDSILRSTGKNLFDINTFNSTYDLGSCSIVEQTTNGFILQGNQGNPDGSNAFSNGWFRPGLQDTTMYLKAGSVVTISVDYTVLEFRYTTDRTETMNKIGVYLYAKPTDGNANLYSIHVVDTENQLYKVTATFTIKKDSLYYPLFTLNSNKVKIENIQIEYGSTATDYEQYQLGPNNVMISSDKKVWKVRYGSKNLFRPDYFITPRTAAGITCQYLPDEDCFLLNGTSTSEGDIRDLNYWFPHVLNKSITISSHYIGGEVILEDNQYAVACVGNSDSLEEQNNFIACSLSPTQGKNSSTKVSTKQGLHNLWFYFSVGVVVNNLKVKIQLEIGTTATAYVPYSRETVWTSNDNNILPVSTADTQTITGITFTNNNDGTITVAGTATANSTFNLGTFNVLKGRPLTLKGCPSGGSASTYFLYAYNTTNNINYIDYGNGVTFTPAVDSLGLYIRVQNGITVNSLLFKPKLEYAEGNN